MIEPTMYETYFRMLSGREYTLTLSDLEIDWLFDKMFEREKGIFQNFGGVIININEIEYVKYKEMKE